MNALHELPARWKHLTGWVLNKSNSRGSVAIEYGILLPVLLLFMFVTIDAGQLLWMKVTLDRAVEAAARCGAIDANNCGTTAQIKIYAVTQAYGMTVASGAFVPVTAACGMQVSASLVFTPSIPLLGSSTIPITASACYSKPAA